MRRQLFHFLLLLIPSIVAMAPETRAATQSHPIVVTSAWARQTAATAAVTAVYLTLVNTGRVADSLQSLATPVAARAEVHETTIVNGIARMQQIKALDLPPNTPISLSPAGKHIMLLDLKRPLRPGSSFPLTMTFARSGSAELTVAVTIGPGKAEVGDSPATHKEH